MSSISLAISPDRVSAISGFQIAKDLQAIALGFSPQAVGILAAKETAFETSALEILDFTNADEVGKAFGYKSTAYAMARILRPRQGGRLGSIKTYILPVDAPVDATSTTSVVTITNNATKTVTHRISVGGRETLDGQSYNFTVVKGDTPTIIAAKMKDAINNVLGAPGTATSELGVLTFTSGSKGTHTKDLVLEVNTNGESAGLTYSIVNTLGTGDYSVSDAISQIGSMWIQHIVNGFGSDSDILDYLETANGNPISMTGRYKSDVFKPFVSYFGDPSIASLEDISSVVDARKDECTNIFCPTPGSKGTCYEAAANWAYAYIPVAQNTPHSDIIGVVLSDMPSSVSTNIGDFDDSDKRDQMVKIGSSTVILTNGKYEIIDFVTTSHPDDELPTSVTFRYVSDLVGSQWNIKYLHKYLENIYVKGKTIVSDNAELIKVDNITSPNRWRSILMNLFAPTLEQNGLIESASDLIKSLQIEQDETNKQRLNTIFRSRTPGKARVMSTTCYTS